MKITNYYTSPLLVTLCLIGVSIHPALAQSSSKTEKIPYSKPVKTKATSGSPKLILTEEKSAVAQDAQSKAGETGLSKEILYKLTASDIALQRGEWQGPFVTIMGLAHQTRDPRLAKRAAEIAMSAQQIDESMSAVHLWRELAPNSQEADQYYLSLVVVKNDYPAIENFYSEWLKKSTPEEKPGVVHQAQRSLNRTSNKQAAFLSLEKILRDEKNSIDGHIALSRAAYRANDVERAQQEAKAALAIDPNSELGILTLANASEKSVAFDLVAEFLKNNPNAKEVRLAYATMLMDSKQLPLAKATFLSFLQDPDKSPLSKAQTLHTLGSIELEMGQLDVAESYFKQVLGAIAKDEDNSTAYISLAQIALQRKDKQTADFWLSKIESNEGKNPAWFTIQMRRAMLLASDRKFLEARQFLQTVKANADSEQVLLLQTEAQIMRDAGQSTEAFVLLQMALSEFPRSPELLYDFAMLAESLKQYPDMEMALKQLIQIAPNNALAYNALGYSYADRNVQLDEALSLIEAANQLNPNDPYILDSLGWVKYRLKQFADAEQYLRLSLGMRQDADVSVHLAEILWVQSKKEEALQLFAEARKRDPDNALLKSTLQRLELNLP
nr:tetratricopeptide repeat protein [uncultured Undibacterium sp.]